MKRIPYGPGPDQFGDLRLPAGDGPHPVVMLIHGGWWRAHIDLEYAGALADALTADGMATWNVEFRRVGAGGGFPQTLEDVTAALAHVAVLAREYGLDAARIVVTGHSAGAHLAAWLASKASHRALDVFGTAPAPIGAVPVAGPLDLERTQERHAFEREGPSPVHEFLGGSPGEVPERYALASPARLVPTGIPVVVVHGTDDASVPLEVSERYVEAALAAGDPVRLITLPGADHFEPFEPETGAGRATRRAIADCFMRRVTQTGPAVPGW